MAMLKSELLEAKNPVVPLEGLIWPTPSRQGLKPTPALFRHLHSLVTLVVDPRPKPISILCHEVVPDLRVPLSLSELSDMPEAFFPSIPQSMPRPAGESLQLSLTLQRESVNL